MNLSRLEQRAQINTNSAFEQWPTVPGLRLWRCLCGPLFSFLLSSRSPFYVLCDRVERRGERGRERDFSRTTHVQNGVSGMMGPRAIIGFASAYRPRIMSSRALAYSPEDLFRHAHNRLDTGMGLQFQGGCTFASQGWF
ncbi:Uncharacterized protein DBV15_01837 [Temnothorax longispinosus]|uniref:Uncharacterized protein n=1 Tax=Temnothorax longispinosus TaxID=300112 RepID=A0A4S2KUY4_9HYME|nr:Uncharacterized protein DBV15_01837 [Temnothorax longispinosus]